MRWVRSVSADHSNRVAEWKTLSTASAKLENWKPTKFCRRGKGWGCDPKYVPIYSRLSAELILRQFVTALEEYAHGDLADLGCGNAPLAGIYLPLVDSAIWADWHESRHREVELDSHVDLNSQLPFPDATFDTILLSTVLEHLAEPDLLFSELSRILRPGGNIIISAPFYCWIHEEPYDYYRFTRFALERFGLKNGLRMAKITESGGGLDVIQDVACKLIATKSRLLAYLIYYLFRFLRRVPGLRGLNAKAMPKMPLSYMAVYQKG